MFPGAVVHHGSMRARAVPLVLAALVLGVAAVVVVLHGRGVGIEVLTGDFRDTRYYEVLYDDDASAEDVVEVAEAPSGIAEMDDGTEVRLYGINDQEGGDAEKAAVQVRRPGADPVAKLVPTALEVTAVGDHAVLHSLSGEVTTVEPDGALREITRNGTDADGMIVLEGYEPADGVEPGDVLVGNDQVVTLYRPSTRTVHEVPLPKVDPEILPDVEIANGRIWLVESEPRKVSVRWSTDGEEWSGTEYVPEPRTGPAGTSAHGDALAIVDSTATDMAFSARTLRVVEDGQVRSIDLPERVDDGYLGWSVGDQVLIGYEQTWFRGGPEGLERFDVPGDVFAMSVAGKDLVALGDDEAWTSPDGGDSWDDLDD